MTTVFRPAILYVDDESANTTLFRKAFETDYLVKTCSSAAEALEILGKEDFPLIVSDQRMPGMTGIELCEKLIDVCPRSTRMILTAYTETQFLLDAINRGHVHDYIVKPWKKSDLKIVFDKAFDQYKQRVVKLKELEQRAAQAEILEQDVKSTFDTTSMIGAATGLKNVVEMIQKAAPTDSTIFIHGETGVGKELIARSVHDTSKRKNQPFMAIHCAALTKSLLESELFGHEKGAFTGADQQKQGRFELADGGTVFLDEIGEIPEDVQIKLLRVLQEREIQRVGGSKTIKVDVRIVSATNKNLSELVKQGRFREDLFYRLNVIPITVPPLRDRINDVPALAKYFVEKFGKQVGKKMTLSQNAIDHLQTYDWPGNIRELQNILERTVILSGGPEIDVEDLKLPLDHMKTKQIDINQFSEPSGLIKVQIQKEEIEKFTQALRDNAGNISEAARALGIARSTLFDRLKKYGLI